MPLDRQRCAVPKMWCGKGAMPKSYNREGSRYECLQQGFGAGMFSERAKNLPPHSLQKIKYIGDKMEARFRRSGIATTTALINRTRNMTDTQINTLLRRILVKSNGALDGRAFNHVLLFLDDAGIDVPQCVVLT
jgi:hypothetical protein